MTQNILPLSEENNLYSDPVPLSQTRLTHPAGRIKANSLAGHSMTFVICPQFIFPDWTQFWMGPQESLTILSSAIHLPALTHSLMSQIIYKAPVCQEVWQSLRIDPLGTHLVPSSQVGQDPGLSTVSIWEGFWCFSIYRRWTREWGKRLLHQKAGQIAGIGLHRTVRSSRLDSRKTFLEHKEGVLFKRKTNQTEA